MTTTNSAELASQASGEILNFSEIQGKYLPIKATVTYGGQASGDIINLVKAPAGYVFDHGYHTADTSSGSATLAYGITGSTGKYRAAATFTATDTPTLFGVVAGMAELDADETIIATIAAHALPAAGTLIVTFVFRKY